MLKLPAHDVLPFENLSPHPDVQEQRATVLWKIANGDASIVIAPVEAASMRLFPASYYLDLARVLRRGEEIDVEELLGHLTSVGYTAMDIVEMPGQFTRRGGILDIYSPEADRPVRIELFGDEIESMRKFDPDSQRSSSPLDETTLLPLTETPVTERLLAAVHARLSGTSLEADADETAEDRVGRAISAGGVTVFPGWEFFSTIAGASGTIFDLFPRCQVFVEEPAMVKNQLERWWNKVEQRHDRSGIGSLITPADVYLRPEILLATLDSKPGLDIDQLGAIDVLDEDTTLGEVAFASRPTLRFHGSIPALIEQLKTLMEQSVHMLLAVPNQGEVERLANLLREYGLPYRLGSRAQHAGSENIYDESSYLAGDLRTPIIVRAPIANGVSFPDSNLVLFGANDLTDEADVTARPVAKKSKTAAFVSDFRDLTIGDYVVHVEHGIARYQGLKEIEQDGVTVEFMILEFAEQARLYVPLTRLDLIQKYRSTEAGPAPVLNRLGSQQWAKTKARVKKAMQDMADELLKLYAQRKSAQGHAFPSDNEFQREFEDAFDYNETDDQLTAIADIKRDMESTMPMDRLLCGDVGYGKTEVAMRAAFKAVQDGKQVAVLTPTTVLSFQHFETFKKRFRQFPIEIEMISRFRTPKEQKVILEQVESGRVDILIGTHRLLSKDLKFHDLGLLVVDEEQRFGVRHKERLKQMRREIDVLAMSATPIPRTLHMSLVGLRDMSIIDTPPKDRMAIQTVVAKFDEKLVRSAVEVELERGGQVYFVHNRVETIYEIAAKISELVPSARVIVGHGQMGEAELERVMLAFMNHEYDVLVATTIIENGLDIPLANTILINRADRHGLSELYQLRGRVGRSNRRAYSYLLIPAEQELDRDRPPPARRLEGIFRPRRRLQDRRPRPRTPRRRQHARRRAKRPHRGHRLRDVYLDARRSGQQAQGRRPPGAHHHPAQPRHQPARRRELYPRRKPAPAHLQEDRRRAGRSDHRRRPRRTRRPLRPAARERHSFARSGNPAPRMRTPRSLPGRSQARPDSYAIHGEGQRRSQPPDDAGGKERQARRAVHPAGSAPLSANLFAAAGGADGNPPAARRTRAGRSGRAIERQPLLPRQRWQDARLPIRSARNRIRCFGR